MPVPLGSFTGGLMQGLTFGEMSRDRKDARKAREEQEVRDTERLAMDRQRFESMMEQNRLQIESLKDAKDSKKRIAALYKGIAATESGDFSLASPEDVNLVYEDQINQGGPEGAKKRFKQFVPAIDKNGEKDKEGRVAVQLNVTPKDGKPYEPMLTQHRSADPGDPVATFYLKDIMLDLQAKRGALTKRAYELAAEGDTSLLEHVREQEKWLQELIVKQSDSATARQHDKDMEDIRHQNTLNTPKDYTAADGTIYRATLQSDAKAMPLPGGPEGGLSMYGAGNATQHYEDIEVPKMLVQAKIAPDLATAYKMHKSGNINFEQAAIKYATEVSKQQDNARVRPGDPTYKTFDQLYDDALIKLQGGGKEGGGYQEGGKYVDGDGNVAIYKNGGFVEVAPAAGLKKVVEPEYQETEYEEGGEYTDRDGNVGTYRNGRFVDIRPASR